MCDGSVFLRQEPQTSSLSLSLTDMSSMTMYLMKTDIYIFMVEVVCYGSSASDVQQLERC